MKHPTQQPFPTATEMRDRRVPIIVLASLGVIGSPIIAFLSPQERVRDDMGANMKLIPIGIRASRKVVRCLQRGTLSPSQSYRKFSHRRGTIYSVYLSYLSSDPGS